MAESITVDKTQPRNTVYKEIFPQIEALIRDEPDITANLANIAAALKSAFDFFWVGFYAVQGDELVLGPFQGPVACNRFPTSKGVCGQPSGKATIIVPDVDAFPGHIACSSASRSEIVVPVLDVNGAVRLVLDVDSDVLNDFTEADQLGLELICSLISEIHYS